MGIVNIACTICGEPMWIEALREVMYEYFPGSPEVKRLFAWDAEGITHVWQCFDCGHFEPVLGTVGRARR